MKIAIIGSGVSGLTCGIRLLERGFKVHVITREESPQTTSDVASAVWYPYRAGPHKRIAPWAETAYSEFAALAGNSETGIRRIPIFHLHLKASPKPWWAKNAQELQSDELFGPFTSGYRHETFLIEPLFYMPYLRRRLESLGGTVQKAEVRSLQELEGTYPIVVNCSGVWAFHLVEDREVFPIRGQVLRIRPSKAIEPKFYDTDLVSLACRSTDCLIGGANADGDWSLEPRHADRELLLTRCRALWPDIGDFEILEDKVGLRPGRTTVRLETERISNELTVIHNYGHAGAGYSVSWGCADEVTSIVSNLISDGAAV